MKNIKYLAIYIGYPGTIEIVHKRGSCEVTQIGGV
jgi:hypothetical protein